jgi:hypothetical protein
MGGSQVLFATLQVSFNEVDTFNKLHRVVLSEGVSEAREIA